MEEEEEEEEEEEGEEEADQCIRSCGLSVWHSRPALFCPSRSQELALGGGGGGVFLNFVSESHLRTGISFSVAVSYKSKSPSKVILFHLHFVIKQNIATRPVAEVIKQALFGTHLLNLVGTRSNSVVPLANKASPVI
jgi:hypothetical protein